MLNLQNIFDTIDMIDKQHLDIRTITMGISLLDCADEDMDRCCDKIYDKTVSNIQQIKARNGRIIALVTRGDEVAAKIADYVIEIPEVCECLSPILTSVPLQLLAYYVAVNKGRNVDQPRNLAKSVTVE